MARTEDVLTTIWEDADFDGLSDDAALIYLWSFTNERCTMAGLYPVRPRSICEGRMTPGRRTAALEELAEARFFYYVDGWAWVRSRVKHLRTKGENMAKSIRKTVEMMPEDHVLRAAFLAEYVEKSSWVTIWLSDLESEDPSEGFPEAPTGSGSGFVVDLKEVKGTGEKEKPKKPDPNVLPDDFPAELISAVEATLPILRRVARAKGAKPVDRLPLGRVVAALPDRDHPMTAGELEHWALHGNGENRQIKDVVSSYRNFLKRADRVAKPTEQSGGQYDAVIERVTV